MMSDMSFLSPSPWLNDFSSIKEGDALTDLPFDALVSDRDIEDIQSLTNWIPELRVPSTYQDSEVSVTNSECSDAPSIEIDVNLEDALLQNLNSTDFLSSAVVTNNQGTCSLQSDLLKAVGLTDSDDDDDDDDDIWELLSTTKNSNMLDSHSKTTDELLSAKVQWSSLTKREQHQLVEDLSTVVSKQLGLREQLEVIRIISPETSLSPTDTQFVIDLGLLDDEKLQRVLSFLGNHLSSRSLHGDVPSKCEQNLRGHKAKHLNSRMVRETADVGDFHSDSNMSCRKSRKRSHRQMASRRRSKMQYKRARQQLKEQRSGLFVKEQIVAVESSEVGELDDVDILT